MLSEQPHRKRNDKHTCDHDLAQRRLKAAKVMGAGPIRVEPGGYIAKRAQCSRSKTEDKQEEIDVLDQRRFVQLGNQSEQVEREQAGSKTRPGMNDNLDS